MANSIPLRFYLQVEGLAVLATATAVYAAYSFSWWLYGILFLAPDLFMLGYLKNPRVGALSYNLGHTYTVPIVLIAAAAAFHSSHALAVGLIWCSHIGFDRLVGYGLKYDSGFKDTHLQKLS
jgi:hypothetical protein